MEGKGEGAEQEEAQAFELLAGRATKNRVCVHFISDLRSPSLPLHFPFPLLIPPPLAPSSSLFHPYPRHLIHRVAPSERADACRPSSTTSRGQRGPRALSPPARGYS